MPSPNSTVTPQAPIFQVVHNLHTKFRVTFIQEGCGQPDEGVSHMAWISGAEELRQYLTTEIHNNNEDDDEYYLRRRNLALSTMEQYIARLPYEEDSSVVAIRVDYGMIVVLDEGSMLEFIPKE